MDRRTLIKLLGAGTAGAALATTLGPIRLAYAADNTLKIGTLFPKSSPWGKVFETWIKAVNEKSGGKTELQFFYNGQQGDDGAMVGKVKAGQLDGVACGAIGLAKMYKPIVGLEMPGLFASWAKADAALDDNKKDLEKGLTDAGFTALGWLSIGQRRIFAKGFATTVPDDLKGKKPCYRRDDSIVPAVYTSIGGVSGVPLNAPEVLPNLNTGAINVVISSALLAEQLQWSGKLDNALDLVVGHEIGALVISTKVLDALPADQKTIITDTGKVAATALIKKIRAEDDAAWGRLKAKMTVATPSADDKTKWSDIFKKARQKLAQGTFTSEWVTKLEGYT